MISRGFRATQHPLRRRHPPIAEQQFGSEVLGAIHFATWPDFMLGLNGAQNRTQAATGVPFSNVLVSITLLGTLAQPRRGWEGSGYFQDDFKVSSRLTLNMGVRYDWLPPEEYITGRATNIDPALLNPNPPAGGSYEGFTVPANYPRPFPAGVTQKPYNSYVRGDGAHNVSPRIGFAYKVLPGSDRFVLRGGYGILPFHHHRELTGAIRSQPALGAAERLPAPLQRHLQLGPSVPGTDSSDQCFSKLHTILFAHDCPDRQPVRPEAVDRNDTAIRCQFADSSHFGPG